MNQLTERLAMKLAVLLEQFHRENGLPARGGEDKSTFQIAVFGLTLTLPNPKFRRDATHIHDIHHVLNRCDTSWKGEGFISGWEIATGMWRQIGLGLFSLWAMGYSLWLHPASVFQGFKKGLNSHGIIDLKISKADLMQMELHELERMARKETSNTAGAGTWMLFLGWGLLSQIILFFPFLILLVGIIAVL